MSSARPTKPRRLQDVTRWDRETVPGLFAVGRTACGIPRRGDGYASGTSVGDATFFGRMAGRRVAAAQRGD